MISPERPNGNPRPEGPEAPGAPEAGPGHADGPQSGRAHINMHDLLKETIAKKASDLHLTVGMPPMFRVDGQLLPGAYAPLKPEVCEKLSYSVLTEDQRVVVKAQYFEKGTQAMKTRKGLS